MNTQCGQINKKMKLSSSLQAWANPEFNHVAKDEIQSIDPTLLPLQKGLSLSSYVSDRPISVTILNFSETTDIISVKAGIFYTGIIAGCSCADDPTPLDEQNEYCEGRFDINKNTAETTVTLLQ